MSRLYVDAVKMPVSTIVQSIVIAACLVLMGCGEKLPVTEAVIVETGKARLDDVEIAKIGGTVLYQSDVERVAVERGIIKPGAPLSQTNPAFQRLLEELIDQRLLMQAAVRRALDKTPENKRRLAAARERILGNILVEAHIKEMVNETTTRRMYEEQSALANRGDEIQARQILLSDEASAKAAQKALEGGQGFAELARSVSTDEATREKGGDLGWFTRDMLDPDFTSKVFTTETGARTAPFQTDSGWHIVEVQNRRAAQIQSFEELQPNIVKFMTFDAIQSLIADLRRKSDIETFYDIDKAAVVTPPEDLDPETDIPDTNINEETDG